MSWLSTLFNTLWRGAQNLNKKEGKSGSASATAQRLGDTVATVVDNVQSNPLVNSGGTLSATDPVDSSSEGVGSDLSHASVLEGIADSTTGNLTYARQDEQREKAEAFSAAEAQKQRDYEERLSNTAYQRQVADLKAAGLSPAFLTNGGSSVPTGATARSSASGVAPTHSAQVLSSLVNVIGSVALKSLSVAQNSAKESARAVRSAQELQKVTTHDYFDEHGEYRGSRQSYRS